VPDGSVSVGGIEKLTIEAFSNLACTKKAGSPVLVHINPETYSRAFGVRYADDVAMGSSGRRMVVDRELGETLTLDLIYDGTGAVPNMGGKSVDERIAQLRSAGLTLTEGSLNTLILSWGSLRFKCQMKTLGVTYTLFNPDGTPLRAKVSAAFVAVGIPEDYDPPKSEKEQGSWVRMRGTGDLGPLCQARYGDKNFMYDVASLNELDSFRGLKPGTMVYFPPKSELTG
jgi:hypothetical protein